MKAPTSAKSWSAIGVPMRTVLAKRIGSWARCSFGPAARCVDRDRGDGAGDDGGGRERGEGRREAGAEDAHLRETDSRQVDRLERAIAEDEERVEDEVEDVGDDGRHDDGAGRAVRLEVATAGGEEQERRRVEEAAEQKQAGGARDLGVDAEALEAERDARRRTKSGSER